MYVCILPKYVHCFCLPKSIPTLTELDETFVQIGEMNMRTGDKLAVSRVLSQISASHDEVIKLFIFQSTVLVTGHGQPRKIQLPRQCVRLCGGNSIGILSESTIGDLNVSVKRDTFPVTEFMYAQVQCNTYTLKPLIRIMEGW